MRKQCPSGVWTWNTCVDTPFFHECKLDIVYSICSETTILWSAFVLTIPILFTSSFLFQRFSFFLFLYDPPPPKNKGFIFSWVTYLFFHWHFHQILTNFKNYQLSNAWVYFAGLVIIYFHSTPIPNVIFSAIYSWQALIRNCDNWPQVHWLIFIASCLILLSDHLKVSPTSILNITAFSSLFYFCYQLLIFKKNIFDLFVCLHEDSFSSSFNGSYLMKEITAYLFSG